MKKTTILLFLLPIIALAADHSDGPKNFDIVPRAINFLVFFGILFFLLKDVVKKAYNDRIAGIVSRLENIENKLKDSKAKKEQSLKDLETAKNRAVDLIEISKKEVELLKDKIQSQTNFEIQVLKKSFDEQKEFELRKTNKSVVSDVLNEVFEDKTIKLTQQELINIIEKKVS